MKHLEIWTMALYLPLSLHLKVLQRDSTSIMLKDNKEPTWYRTPSTTWTKI